MRHSRPLVTLTTIAGLALAAVAAAPTSSDVSVAVTGTTITVAGTLDEPIGTHVIGTDAVGDSTFNGLGGDFSEMSIAFPRPGILQYRVSIGDPNPATGIMPHGLRVDVNGISVGATTLDINANSHLDTGVTVGTTSCAPGPGGVNNCSTSEVDGGYEDGAIVWDIPMTMAGGTTVIGASAVAKATISTGTTGGVYANTAMDTIGINAYAAVPSATLLVDGQTAGTAAVSDAGYSVKALGVTAGEHALALRLCGPTADFSGAQTDCQVLDLGTVTVG